MKGEWCYFKGVFTKEQCNQILNDGLQLPAQKAKLGVAGENEGNEYRKSDIRFIQKYDVNFQWLFDDLWKLAITANSEWFNFHITKLDYIQLAEYSHEYKGEYKKHHDVFWINNDTFYHRKITCIIQLTDDTTYDGGDLELYDINEVPNASEMRTQGTAIFFPSFIPHAALPITRGVRHSLAVWFDGPKWR